MIGYSEEMFVLEKRIALAHREGDTEAHDYLAGRLRDLGALPCGVCGTMIAFHHLDGWAHEEQGMDHDARPDRGGFEWPSDVPQPTGREAH